MNATQKTRQIVELLKLRHPAPQWAHFVELSEGVSNGAIDFFAINMWKSNGHLKVAYEVKVSRADFSRELNQPNKRLAAEQLADECYFVMPVGVAKKDEIPEGWGLMILQKNGFKIMKRAQQRRVKALPIPFVCAIARRSADPPSKLPDVFWKVAGEEVDSEQLIAIGLEKSKQRVKRERQLAVKEYKESKEIANLRGVTNVVSNTLGYPYTDPVKLKEWIENSEGTGIKAREYRKASLKRLLNTTQQAMERLKEELEII